MAVIWSLEARGKRYEVRAAGRTRRLYTDGVFHSHYNPLHGVTGGVWDLLMLPAFLLPREKEQPLRVLVLGVGGGAVLKMLERFAGPVEITGVDLDAVHLEVAREHFEVPPSVKLHRGDAMAWVHRYRGRPFDLIIEDLFGGRGEPERALCMDRAWAGALLTHLAGAGALVTNFVDPAELKRSALYADRTTRRCFARGLQFTTRMDTNAVGAFYRQAVDPDVLRPRLQQQPLLDTRRAGCRLRFRMRRLW
jgi:spermidine synthase